MHPRICEVRLIIPDIYSVAPLRLRFRVWSLNNWDYHNCFVTWLRKSHISTFFPFNFFHHVFRNESKCNIRYDYKIYLKYVLLHCNQCFSERHWLIKYTSASAEIKSICAGMRWVIDYLNFLPLYQFWGQILYFLLHLVTLQITLQSCTFLNKYTFFILYYLYTQKKKKMFAVVS